MDELKKTKTLGLVGWLLLFLALGIIIGIFLSHRVSASWPLSKDVTCNLLGNVTGETCDQTWCGIISNANLNCAYNSTLFACLCNNNQIIVNDSGAIANFTGYYNISDVYNKSEIDSKFNNISLAFLSNVSSMIDNKTLALRDSISTRLDNFEGNHSGSAYIPVNDGSSQGVPTWAIIGGIGVLLIIAALFFFKSKEPKRVYAPATSSVKRPFKKPVEQKKTEVQQPIKTQEVEEVQEAEETPDPNQFYGDD